MPQYASTMGIFAGDGDQTVSFGEIHLGSDWVVRSTSEVIEWCNVLSGDKSPQLLLSWHFWKRSCGFICNCCQQGHCLTLLIWFLSCSTYCVHLGFHGSLSCYGLLIAVFTVWWSTVWIWDPWWTGIIFSLNTVLLLTMHQFVKVWIEGNNIQHFQSAFDF